MIYKKTAARAHTPECVARILQELRRESCCLREILQEILAMPEATGWGIEHIYVLGGHMLRTARYALFSDEINAIDGTMMTECLS